MNNITHSENLSNSELFSKLLQSNLTNKSMMSTNLFSELALLSCLVSQNATVENRALNTIVSNLLTQNMMSLNKGNFN